MGGAWKEPSLPGVKGAERKKEIKMRRNMRASDIFNQPSLFGKDGWISTDLHCSPFLLQPRFIITFS